jgi:hypothetical protein
MQRHFLLNPVHNSAVTHAKSSQALGKLFAHVEEGAWSNEIGVQDVLDASLGNPYINAENLVNAYRISGERRLSHALERRSAFEQRMFTLPQMDDPSFLIELARSADKVSPQVRRAGLLHNVLDKPDSERTGDLLDEVYGKASEIDDEDLRLGLETRIVAHPLSRVLNGMALAGKLETKGWYFQSHIVDDQGNAVLKMVQMLGRGSAPQLSFSFKESALDAASSEVLRQTEEHAGRAIRLDIISDTGNGAITIMRHEPERVRDSSNALVLR